MDHLRASPGDRADGPQLARARPWVAHYAASVPACIDLPEEPLQSILVHAAAEHGANDAVVFYGTRISYARLLDLATRFAGVLRRLGVHQGDRVAISLPNVPQFPIAFFGALMAGAIVVPTNPVYTKRELEHQLNDAGVTLAVMFDQSYPVLAGVRERTHVGQVVLAGVADYLPRHLALAYRLRSRKELRAARDAERADPTVHYFTHLLAEHGEPPSEPVPAPTPDDIAVLQYTGGTTGVAKGAMLTHRNLLANAMQTWTWNEQPLGSKHIALCVAPFFHVYGLTVAMNMSVYNGSAMVLLPRFTVKDTLSAIKRYKPDMFPGVPTMYLALARAAEQDHSDLSSVKICISGSAPLPLEIQQHFERVSSARVVEGYGLTEASPVTHCNPVFGDRRIGTIGLPLPNTDAAIIDAETWRFLAPGAQGEIVVRGPQVMRGYWHRPDETAKVLRDGWLRTGDIGSMSEEGYFRVEDRAKDVIIAGGFNIFPREVEEVLYQHPKVLEAAVIGVPDSYRGETVRAYIVVKPHEHVTAEELEAFCREHLAPYKVPRQFEFRDSLPKTIVGKVLRRALREGDAAQTETETQQPPRSDRE